ncbi:MAG TPA: BBP7 family outer membrane beta-barrel protein [Lacipirellulaceae bacterium]|jgi:hypothetical protein|nr:BBP7 family outer membrane beta-barrel protein [Lacipirellulaceae bacterium]
MLHLRRIASYLKAPGFGCAWVALRALLLGTAVFATSSPAYIGVYDDIDPDQGYGPALVIDGNGGLFPVVDYDDLHTFSIFLNHIAVVGIPYSGAVDAVDVIWLSDKEEQAPDQPDDTIVSWQTAEALRIRDWQVTGIDGGSVSPLDMHWPGEIGPAPQMAAAPQGNRRNDVGIIYGMRVIERQNGIYISADGGIIGPSYWHTEAENHVFGPQLGLVLLRNRGPWSIRLQATAMAGFNYGDVEQHGSMGQRQIPGALNQPIFARPAAFHHVDPHDEISPSGELRMETTYRLTHNVSFAITWSGIAIRNALLVEDRIRDFQPDAGLADPGEQQIFVHNLFCGVTVVL